jgi:hypothetical protein
MSHRGYVYRLGGKTSAGDYSASVQMATVAADGSLSAWSDGTALPSARAYQSVVAYAEYLYLIGGKDASGYLDDVWYTYIYPDGRLGASWTKSGFTLPEGRAAASAFVLDGRMYLAGGQGTNGPSGQLLSSRIWRDGEPGLWAPMANTLPSARMGASALRLGDRVYLAGGKSSSGYLSEVLVSRIATDGHLGSWTAGAALPDARAFAALVPHGDYPAVLGGEGVAGAKDAAYTFDASSTWGRDSAFDGLWSGQAAVSRGYACIVRERHYWGQTGDLGVGLVELPQKAAEAPTAKPAGGYVKKNAGIALFAAPGETIRYTMATGGVEPADPDGSSTLYDDASRPKIAADTILKARSFGTALEASEVARLSFKMSSTSLVYTIEKTLGPAASYRECVLQETYSNGSTNPLNSIWYALSVYQRGWYSLSIRDKDDDAATYTDSVTATLFEGDVLSLLRDSSDGEIDQRQDNVRVYLDAGTYFLRLASTTAANGGSFALRFSEEHSFIEP